MTDSWSTGSRAVRRGAVGNPHLLAEPAVLVQEGLLKTQLHCVVHRECSRLQRRRHGAGGLRLGLRWRQPPDCKARGEREATRQQWAHNSGSQLGSIRRYTTKLWQPTQGGNGGRGGGSSSRQRGAYYGAAVDAGRPPPVRPQNSPSPGAPPPPAPGSSTPRTWRGATVLAQVSTITLSHPRTDMMVVMAIDASWREKHNSPRLWNTTRREDFNVYV